jgi:hypothetical protein
MDVDRVRGVFLWSHLLAFGADSFVELLSATVVLFAIVPSFPLSRDRAARPDSSSATKG